MHLFLRMCAHHAPESQVRVSCRRVTRLWIISSTLIILMIYTVFTLFTCVQKRNAMSEKLKYLKIQEVLGSGLAANKVKPDISTVLVSPDSIHCKDNGAGIYTLFMVISSPEHSKARDDIRYGLKFFMNDYNDIRNVPNDIRENELLFFIGISSDPQVQTELEIEAKLHGDIIIDEMQECYLCLSLKILRMLKWVRAHCSLSEFVAKVDDDVHLNLPKLFQYLRPLSGTRAGANLIGGSLFEEAPAVRDPDSKWYVPMELYPVELFPTYVGGTFYVLGYEAVRKIYAKSLEIQLFHLEDVFLTGIVAWELHLSPTMLAGIFGDWRPIDHLFASSCTIRNRMLSVHFRYKAWNYMKCWREFNRRNFVCSQWPLILSFSC